MKSLVIAPHPDDEVLGCGGTLLRRRAEGADLGWLIVTGISESSGWSAEQVRRRDDEIENVAGKIGFSHVFRLDFPATSLDRVPIRDLIDRMAAAFAAFGPEEVFVPCRSDAHTDHRAVFDAAAACTKWFRYPSVLRVLAYETPSETGFGLDAAYPFIANWYIDISKFLDRKIELMSVYRSELGDFPFPRSIEVIRSLAAMRGAASGFRAAEAFQLLRQRS